MRPSLKALRSRASERAHAAAEGTGIPAGVDEHGAGDPRPGAVERGNMRRRLRRARRLRETLMTELGALVMEMHRQGRHDPALVERKAREALVADREVAGLARALRTEQTLAEVVAAGIAGTCRSCGALLATDDRFCSRCGARAVAALNGRPAAPQGSAVPSAPPPDPARREPAPATPSRVLPPRPPAAAPPDAGTRVAAPPDPRGRAVRPAPASRPASPPPPDPSTRVPRPGSEADTVRIATPKPRR